MKSLINHIIKSTGAIPAQAVFLGGSHAKGWSDEHSDLDFGWVYSDQEQLEPLTDQLSKALGEPFDTIEKELSLALYFSIQGFRFEIRLVNFKHLRQTVQRLHRGFILDGAEQDLLENLRVGRIYRRSPQFEVLKHLVRYPESLKRKTLSLYLPLLNTNSLKTPVLRKDHFHIMTETLDLKQALIVLASAQSKRFLSSFKHERGLLEGLSPYVSQIYEALKKLNYSPSLASLEALDHLVYEFKLELENEIKPHSQRHLVAL